MGRRDRYRSHDRSRSRSREKRRHQDVSRYERKSYREKSRDRSLEARRRSSSRSVERSSRRSRRRSNSRDRQRSRDRDYRRRDRYRRSRSRERYRNEGTRNITKESKHKHNSSPSSNAEDEEKRRRRKEKLLAWKKKQQNEQGGTNEEDKAKMGQGEGTVKKEEDENLKKEIDATKEQEDDPLDAFMAKAVSRSKKEIADALEKERKEAKILAEGGTLRLSETNTDLREDEMETMMKNNKHCYVCKQFGHTKRDCPQKKCTFCYQPGHIQSNCAEWMAELERRAKEDKKKKLRRFYENKKARRREERIHKLRCATGVYGFQTLYKLLGLPVHKLASMTDIRKAFNKQSLVWHPDKHATKSDEEKEKAAEKYAEVRDAYDLLMEGLERGNLEGMAVVNAGDLADLAKG
mmetsp:Transcript_823/g.880  ORF Transcript_823/g.880 Transcript_823/m.880 type:complete len:407 (-) Transcript_823:1748-2968(-)